MKGYLAKDKSGDIVVFYGNKPEKKIGTGTLVTSSSFDLTKLQKD